MNLDDPDPSYVELYRRLGVKKDVEPWLFLAKEFSPNDKLLILGCGTGYLSVPFFDFGYKVVGVDANNAMLSVIRELRPDLKTVNCKICNLDLQKRFGAVFLPSGLFSNCNDSSRLEMIECIKRHIQSDGWIGIELIDLEWLRKVKSVKFPTQEILSHSFNTRSLIYRGKITYIFSDARYFENFYVQGFNDKLLSALLREHGLRLVKKVRSSPLSHVYIVQLDGHL